MFMGNDLIEGNSLSQSEVRNYLYKDQSPCGKSHNELLQTRNHFKVKEFLQDYRGEINTCLIHELMMNGVDVYDRNDKAGKYRKDMTKAGGHWTGSKPEDIEEHLCSSLEIA